MLLLYMKILLNPAGFDKIIVTGDMYMEKMINYNMNIDRNSSWSVSNTPAVYSSGLPLVINSCGHFSARNKYYTERSGFESFIVLHTLSGAGRLIFRGKEFILKKGYAAIMDCREYQYYGTSETDSNGFWCFNYIHFDGAAANEYHKAINGDTFLILKPDNDELKRLFSQIAFELKNRSVLVDYKTLELTICYLTRLIESKHMNSSDTPASRYRSEIESVIKYIQQNYADSLSVSLLASLVPMSRYHFIRIFKEYAGLSPYEYIILYRINKAKSFLKETGISVAEVAYSVGFRDASNFIRYFKKVVGTTPEYFRKYWIG